MTTPAQETRPMSEAPRDGTVIMLHVRGHPPFKGRLVDGFIDRDDNQCASWVAEDEEAPPKDWHDGVCWASNADGDRSSWPEGWSPARLGKAP